MRKVLEMIVLVGLPTAWGLGVEWVFERIRRRLARCDGPATSAARGRPGGSDGP